jgi:hypothetical protein
MPFHRLGGGVPVGQRSIYESEIRYATDLTSVLKNPQGHLSNLPVYHDRDISIQTSKPPVAGKLPHWC